MVKGGILVETKIKPKNTMALLAVPKLILDVFRILNPFKS